MKKQIDIGRIPKVNCRNGLIAILDRETKNETIFSFADIVAGQRYYDYPKEGRKVVGVYINLLVSAPKKKPKKS